jgi:hypothetical protein
MSRPAGDTRQYRITIRGECARLLLCLLDNVQVESSRNGATCVVASVRDDPEFWGLMEQFRDLALHVVSLTELDHGDARAATSQVPTAAIEPG